MISVIIIVLTTFIAINSLLFQPLINPNDSVIWSNINFWGKLRLFALLILCGLSINQVFVTDKQTKIKEELLIKERNDQVEFSKYLIKVASNCEGYTVLVRGTVDFSTPQTEESLRKALKNMFLKYGAPVIEATNIYGNFKCNLFFGNYPEVQRFLNLSISPTESEFLGGYYSNNYSNPFFFELKYKNIKPLNENGILFIKHGDSKIRFDFKIEEYYVDFRRLYNIRSIDIKELIINEFPPIKPNEDFINI